jgi:hypothetical protein
MFVPAKKNLLTTEINEDLQISKVTIGKRSISLFATETERMNKDSVNKQNQLRAIERELN